MDPPRLSAMQYMWMRKLHSLSGYGGWRRIWVWKEAGMMFWACPRLAESSSSLEKAIEIIVCTTTPNAGRRLILKILCRWLGSRKHWLGCVRDRICFWPTGMKTNWCWWRVWNGVRGNWGVSCVHVSPLLASHWGTLERWACPSLSHKWNARGCNLKGQVLLNHEDLLEWK